MGRLRKMQKRRASQSRGLGASKRGWGSGNWPDVDARRSSPRALPFTRKDLRDAFGRDLDKAYPGTNDTDEALDALLEILQWEKKPQRLMEFVDEILDGHGVEAVWNPFDSGDVLATYVNMGDTYVATILWDYGAGAPVLTDWGGWYENWENENVERCPIDNCDSQFSSDDHSQLEDHLREQHAEEIWVVAKEKFGADGPEFLSDVTWIGEPDQATVYSKRDRHPMHLKGDKARWMPYETALEAHRANEEDAFDSRVDALEWWEQLLEGLDVVPDPTGKSAPAAPAAAPAPAATVRADRCPHCKAKIRPLDRNCYGCGKKV